MSVVTVTGGAGFIGRVVCTELRARGHQVSVFDRSHGFDVLTEPIHACDAVIHLAGVLGTSELFDCPETAVDVNVKGTLHVLESCRLHHARYVGITMPDSGWPSIYQATKLAATRLAEAWHHAYGTPVSHVRAFNVFGPGQHTGSPRKIIPTFAEQGWSGRPIEVWGDGSQTVDLIHVTDVARMLVDALRFGNGETFDAGTGHAVTVNRVAEYVQTATGGRSEVAHLPMRTGETDGTDICATGEGWDLLDWRPQINLEALLDTVRSYRSAVAA